MVPLRPDNFKALHSGYNCLFTLEVPCQALRADCYSAHIKNDNKKVIQKRNKIFCEGHPALRLCGASSCLCRRARWRWRSCWTSSSRRRPTRPRKRTGTLLPRLTGSQVNFGAPEGCLFYIYIFFSKIKFPVVLRIRAPGSGAFLTPWIWDPRWIKNQDPDPVWITWIIFFWELRNNFLR